MDCTIKQHSDGTTGPSHYDCWLQIIMADAETRDADLAYEFFAGFTQATGQANARNFPSWQPDTTKQLKGHLATGYTHLHDSALADLRTKVQQAEELLSQLNPLVGRLQNLQRELDVFGRRTGGITFDNETSWKEVVDADGSTFGKFLIVEGGDNINNYPNFDDYEDAKWRVEGIEAFRPHQQARSRVGGSARAPGRKQDALHRGGRGGATSCGPSTATRCSATQARCTCASTTRPPGTVGYWTATTGDPLTQEPKQFNQVLWPGQSLVMENLSTTSTPVWTDELGDELITGPWHQGRAVLRALHHAD